MSKILTIATCQYAVSGEVKHNLSAIRKHMRYARSQDADIIHFPECSLGGYAGIDFPKIIPQEYTSLQKAIVKIRELAAGLGLWVILGSHHFEQGMKKPFNSLCIINNKGEIVDRYDKRFLAGLHGDREPEHYFPGANPVVFRINGFKCGLLICHEWRYPELYREYYKLNVEIIFQSWYDGNLSREKYEKNGRELGELIPGTVRGNAASNYMWISVSNSSRKESSFPAMMVQPDGRVLQKLHRNRAGVLISRINSEQVFIDPSSHNRKQIIKNQT